MVRAFLKLGWLVWGRALFVAAPLEILGITLAVAAGVALWTTLGVVADGMVRSTRQAVDVFGGRTPVTVGGRWFADAEGARLVEETDGVRFAFGRIVLDAERDGAALQVIGLAWELEAMGRTLRIRAGEGDLDRLRTEAGALAVSKRMASALDAGIGAPLRLVIDGREVVGKVAVVFDPVGVARVIAERRVFTSLATARQWSGVAGGCNRLDLLLEPEASVDVVRAALRERYRGEPVVEVQSEPGDGPRTRAARWADTWRLLGWLGLVAGVVVVGSATVDLIARRGPVLDTLGWLGIAPGRAVLGASMAVAVPGLVGGLAGVGIATLVVARLAPGVAAVSGWFLPVERAMSELQLDSADWRLGALAGVGLACAGVWWAFLARRLAGPRLRRRPVVHGVVAGIALAWVMVAAEFDFGSLGFLARLLNALAALGAAVALALPAAVVAAWVTARISAAAPMLVVIASRLRSRPARGGAMASAIAAGVAVRGVLSLLGSATVWSEDGSTGSDPGLAADIAAVRTASLGLLDDVGLVVLTTTLLAAVSLATAAARAGHRETLTIHRLGATHSQRLGLALGEAVLVGFATGTAAGLVAWVVAVQWGDTTVPRMLGVGLDVRGGFVACVEAAGLGAGLSLLATSVAVLRVRSG